MPNDDSPWFTPKDCSRRAQCGVKMIYNAIKTGQLRAARIGARRDIRIHRDWLDEWLVAASTPVEFRLRKLA